MAFLKYNLACVRTLCTIKYSLHGFLSILFLFADQRHAVEKGDISIVLISPEAMFEDKWRQVFHTDAYRDRIRTIVVDEAHCVIDW
jgi:hypothetical protein